MTIYRLLFVTAPMTALLVAILSVLAVERDRKRLDRSGLASIVARPWVDPVVTGSVTRRKVQASRVLAAPSSTHAH